MAEPVKKGLMGLLIGKPEDEPDDGGDAPDEGDEDTVDEDEKDAAEDILAAVKARDAEALRVSLKRFVMACYKGDEEDGELAVGTISEADLMTRARERADMVGSTFVTDAELQEMVRRNASALYDKLIAARGQEYYSKTSQASSIVATSHGDGRVQLPVDFYQLLAVRVGGPGFTGGSSGGRAITPIWRTAQPFDREMVSRYREMFDQGQGPTCLSDLTYRLGGADSDDQTFGYDILSFFPVPTADLWVWEIDYIPFAFVNLQGGGTGAASMYIDALNDWDDYIIWKTVAQMLAKEQSDTSFALSMVADAQQRIDSLAGARDAGKPERIRGRREVLTGIRHRRRPW